ncbi:formylglycine-generating enzyme family protein [Bacteroidota bacterium]
MKSPYFLPLFITVLILLGMSSKKEDIPLGTVPLKKNLYIDATEMSNLDWRTYMYWIKEKYGSNSEEYKQTLPDTTVWNHPLLEAYQKTYLRHPAFNDCPVVGITYEQAIGYCKWRTDLENEYIYIEKNKLKFHPDSIYKNIPKTYEFRLPTPEEFERAARIKFKPSIQKKIDKDEYNTCNCRFEEEEEYHLQSITSPVESYFPNESGIYNLIGNVAEMTSVRGIAKGGSWMHYLDEIKIKEYNMYSKPQNWLGFRCVCVRLQN